jgi:hypothetical protein
MILFISFNTIIKYFIFYYYSIYLILVFEEYKQYKFHFVENLHC